MRCLVTRESFQRAFDAASPVCPTKTENPHLLNIKLTANKDGTVLLQATDHEVSLTVKTTAQVEQPGTCLLPAQTVSAVLSQSSEDKLLIESPAVGKVRVAGEMVDFAFNTENVAEFPSVRGFDATSGKYSTVSALWLKEAVRRTVGCCDPNNSNFAIGGLLFEFTQESKKAFIVAADGRRCSVMRCEAPPTEDHHTPERSIILPQKASRRLASAIDGTEGDVDICCHGGNFSLRSGNVEFHALLLSARFPNWRAGMKSLVWDMTTATLPAGILASLVRQAMIVTSKETRGLQFQFTPSLLTVSSVFAERGQSQLSCPVVLQGEPVTVELNGRYVLDFVALLPPETPVTVGLKDGESVVGLSVEDGWTYGLSPLVREDESEPEPVGQEVGSGR